MTNKLAFHNLPSFPWPYTDDTQVALLVVSALQKYGTIEQNYLAESFVVCSEPSRGYIASIHSLLIPHSDLVHDPACVMPGSIVALASGAQSVAVARKQAEEPLPDGSFVDASYPLENEGEK
jgi:hypothetical protein